MKLWLIVRCGRRLLAGSAGANRTGNLFASQRIKLVNAVTMVRAFCVCLLFLFINTPDAWERWAHAESLALQWPVAWLEYTNLRAGVFAVVAASLAGALLSAAYPGVRGFRVLAAAGALCYSALWNSTSGWVHSHGWHGWVWVAVLFAFLPSGGLQDIIRSRWRVQRYLRVFWSAQAAILFFYSLSGMFKLAGATYQIANGQIHAFMPDALARHTAARLLEAAWTPSFSLGPLLIEIGRAHV